jgi:hypothetical protein
MPVSPRDPSPPPTPDRERHPGPAPQDEAAETGSAVNVGGSGEPHEAGRNSGRGSEETRRAD